ncbi:uncharacterized protein LOC121641658 [Melanotaenia boesemani]|uniref:uncharacterized protein LOC121641658 n=1 Tax=Melanotaenia boesemani TaxID=1250792 RepID=UPI001C0456A0|nr:uncharacterized protein LOC121641658 [Melanotaenia boesemani]
MNVSEELEDRSSFKTALFSQNEDKTRINSHVDLDRPDSPILKHVYVSSDMSKDQAIDFKDGDSGQQSHLTQESPDQPVPRGLSMSSDMSKDQSIEFKDGDSGQQSHLTQEKPDQPVPRGLSMSSDMSKDQAIEFKDGDSGQQSHLTQESPDQPVPRGLSMSSDMSKDQAIEFKDKNHSVQQSLSKLILPETSVSSSMRSDQSKEEPVESKAKCSTVEQSSGDTSTHGYPEKSERLINNYQTHMDSVFLVLERDIITFVKNELMKFKKVVSRKYQKESDWFKEDDEEMTDEGEQRNKDALLKITVNFLKRRKEEELADSLESRTLTAICQHNLKSNLKRRFQSLFEGGSVNQVYTDLHIIECGGKELNGQHEVRQIEEASWKPTGSEVAISCVDIFKPVPGREEPVKTLMTKGVAGIGKTILTQKFILDWAEDKSNHNIEFVFPFTFRELNLLNAKSYSLVELIHHLFNETKEARISSFEKFQVVFIFDGLDECQPPLDFNNTQILTDVTESSSVHVLLINLIKGNLLPSARLWITARPAAANQIPPGCVDMVTEVRGFTDQQKEEYFKKTFRDEEQASRIISHIKASRILHNMCHIPVFCWIAATVLDYALKSKEKAELPKTLTEMYIYFLLVQTKKDNVKYHKRAETDPVWSAESKEILLVLGKLAFEQLEKGNLIFYEEDLKEYGIDIQAASVYAGVFTEVSKKNFALNQERAFSFVHLSIQEFLAALYVSMTFMQTGVNLLGKQRFSLRQKSKHKHLYKSAVDTALQSPNGCLDMFVRFLLGLSQNTNQILLQGLVRRTRGKPQVKDVLVQYITKKIKSSPSTEKSINLFYWLNELNHHSLEEQIQQYLNSGNVSEKKLTASQWSALAFILLSSQENLTVFDLKKFSTSEEALVQLQPVVKASKKSLLSSCDLSWKGCLYLLPALISENSSLRELDLSNNDLKDTGVQKLSDGLKHSHCRLEVLSLSGCLITGEGCASLAAALSSNPSHLRKLDLSFNHPGESGLELLSAGLQDPKWRLETLKTDHCGKSRLKPSPIRYFCELSLDPNTANRNLCLSEDKRQVVVNEEQPYPDHPERFDSWKQLLCSDGLTGRCYWEVRWKGRVRIGVTYRGIRRKGKSDDCSIGWNNQSWSLFCSTQGFTAWHNNTPTDIETVLQTNSNRIAVYLDWSAGRVSFYYYPSVVSSVKKIHLYTFQSTFTEPLYPAFGFGRSVDLTMNSSVTLTQIKRKYCLKITIQITFVKLYNSVMNVSEKLEDHSSFKTALFSQNEDKTRINSHVDLDRPDSPILKHVYVSSDMSKDQAIEFKDGDSGQQSHLTQESPDQLVPRSLSMSSDMSKDLAIEFKDGDSGQQSHLTQESPDQLVPRSLSMSSDMSKDLAIEFKDGDSGQQSHLTQESPDKPVPRGLSMSSDMSKDLAIEFKDEKHSVQQTLSKLILPETSVSSSMRSDQSKEEPVESKAKCSTVEQSSGDTSTHGYPEKSERLINNYQTHVDSVFLVLERDIITFVKNELMKFKKVVSLKYQKESDWFKEDDEEMTDEEEQRNKDALLKITVNFLKRRKEEELADSLESRTLTAICQHNLKSNLKRRFQSLFEGGSVNQVYTDLHIIECGGKELNGQHEVRQIEEASWKPTGSEVAISCVDIFKPVPGREEPVKTLMTKGVAGIGKTILTQKFILDWAEDKSNHNIEFVFPFTFRELNLLNAKSYSLVELIHHLFNETKEARISSFEKFQVVFIFDGLDECQPPLDFNNTQILTDVTESSSVHVLLINLIKGNLLPSARLWITARPAAANQIPPGCVDMVTEVRGFTDQQKEEYFKKIFRDEEQASRIISHIKASRILHNMCHIPVFCWIAATVLDYALKSKEKAELPKTLTEMYIYFLLVQTKKDNVKYHKRAETDPVWSAESKKILLVLGRLAFEQLEKGNLIFYEEDLKEYGIDIQAASVYAGVFTEVSKKNFALNQERAFSFVHLSIQEFLAALYVSMTSMKTGVNLLGKQQFSLRQKSKHKHLYKSAVDTALQSPNGRLDMFVLFLLGLSQKTNQILLRGLVRRTRGKPQVKDVLVQYITKKIKSSPSTEKSINLFYWLNELNHHSLEKQIQQYLNSGNVSEKKLTASQWSALAFILLSSQENLTVFDLKKFSTSEEALVQLQPVVKASKKSLLSSCDLSWKGCLYLLPALISENSSLRELDLSNNDLKDTGVQKLSDGLKHSHCRLEVLSLSGCLITGEGCASLAAALSSNPSHLRKLDLSFNHPGESGLELLSAGLQDPKWRLETLKTDHCGKSRLKPSPIRYFCELSLDPNTANRNLCLSEDKRQVVVNEEQPYPDHPERFDSWKQLLCSDGLTGRCYWEVRWKGRVRIGVTYRGIRRKGKSDDCSIGWNNQSWSLICSTQGFTAWHNNTPTDIETVLQTNSNRIAVYLDWSAGRVSFYYYPSVVSSVKKIHLYTFQSTFTEPLYPAFGFGRSVDLTMNSSVTLTQIKN